MIKMSKERVREILEANPCFFIGKEVMFKGVSVKILDVNLKCTMFKVERPNSSMSWINVEDSFDDDIIFDSCDPGNCFVTVKTICNLLNNKV